MRNWAELLAELLSLICERVDSFKDLVSFGGVCSRWRIPVLEQNSGHPLLPFPWLMLAEHPHEDKRNFYSVTEDKIYSFELPELRGKMCMETKGWIVTASDKGEMALVQPLTRVQIPLPHQNTSECFVEFPMDPLFFVQRVVLSSIPDPKNEKECVVMIIHGGDGHLGFCRLGDKNWTVVGKNGKYPIQTIEYYRGKLYGLHNCGDMWEYDVIGNSTGKGPVSSRKLRVDLNEYTKYYQVYLVESAGSLLVVMRDGVLDCHVLSSIFLVFEIDLEDGSYKEVRSLGSRAIFLGHSTSLSLDTIWYPGITPNSIYFTDDSFALYLDDPQGGGMNMGVYDFGERSVQPHYCGKSSSFICPPVWTFLTSR